MIVNKKAINEKYAGGVEQFRIDYEIPLSEINQEDDELFSLGQMNADQQFFEIIFVALLIHKTKSDE